MGVFIIIIAVISGIFMLVFATLYCRAHTREIVAAIASGERDDIIIARERRARRSRAFRTVRRIIFCSFLAVALGVAAHAAVFRLSGGRVYAGYAGLVVGSGSMSRMAEGYALPQDVAEGFDTFDIIFIEHVEEDELRLYDIAAFYSSKGVLTIHRIVDSFYAGGTQFYVTRGDANAGEDAEAVSYSSMIGIYTGVKLPFAGAIVLFLQSWYGIVSVAAVVYMAVVYDRCLAKISHAMHVRALEIDE